jgi:hypothetical protein
MPGRKYTLAEVVVEIEMAGIIDAIFGSDISPSEIDDPVLAAAWQKA